MRDVVRYRKSCHICQVAGKPNQTIPPPLLYPIVCEPFEQDVVDCVGPLPCKKAGNKFLLTVMCVSTRFPVVFPLRKITTPVVVKALTKLFVKGSTNRPGFKLYVRCVWSGAEGAQNLTLPF